MASTSRWSLFAAAAVGAFLAGFSSTVSAGERFDHRVRSDFFAGFSGNAEALRRAMATCERVLADSPKHAEALVWHGAGLFFQGGLAFRDGDPNRGITLSQRGQKEMDDAVALEPDNIGVRIPRGGALLQASRGVPDPDAARRMLLKALSDYQHVYQLQKDKLDTLGEHPKGELLSGIADAAGRAGDLETAETFWQRIAKEMPGSPYARRAALWLQNRSLPPSETGCIGCHVQ